MAGRQKRIVGNAKEDWWKSSERVQDEQWQKQYDMNRQQYNQELARQRSTQQMKAQQRSKQVADNIRTVNKQQMNKAVNQKKWEDEYRKANNKYGR